jgi:hypothetical protein
METLDNDGAIRVWPTAGEHGRELIEERLSFV